MGTWFSSMVVYVCLQMEQTYYKITTIEEFWLDIIKAVIIFFLTTIFGLIITNKLSIIKENNKHLSNYGIKEIGAHGNADLKFLDKVRLFGHFNAEKPTELCFFFMTGNAFFRKYLKTLTSLAIEGCQINILVSDYSSCRFRSKIDNSLDADKKETAVAERVAYYRDIVCGNDSGQCFLDRTTAMLAAKDFSLLISDNPNDTESAQARLKEHIVTNQHEHSIQIAELINKVNAANKTIKNQKTKDAKNSKQIKIRFYKDEYRFPIMIAKYEQSKKNNKKRVYKRVWADITAPVQEARESIKIFAEAKGNKEAPFVDCVINSFDYVWNRYSSTENTQR